MNPAQPKPLPQSLNTVLATDVLQNIRDSSFVGTYDPEQIQQSMFLKGLDNIALWIVVTPVSTFACSF